MQSIALPPLYLDLETTGLNPKKDEILEIAIVQEDGTTLVNTLVQPLKTQEWPEAQKINGITYDMVIHAPVLAYLTRLLKHILKNRTVYIWNAPFDAAFMQGLLNKSTVVCAMQEFGHYIERTQPHNISKTGRYKLDTTASDLGIQIQGTPHRAITDVNTMINIRKTYRHPSFNRTDLNGSINTEAYSWHESI